MACATTEYSTEYVVCTSPGHQHTFALHNVRDRRAIPASCRSLFLRVRLRAAAGKENTDWNFQGQCKGQSCLRLFFFFRTQRAKELSMLCQYIYALQVEFFVPVAESTRACLPSFFALQIGVCRLVSGGNCDDELTATMCSISVLPSPGVGVH